MESLLLQVLADPAGAVRSALAGGLKGALPFTIAFVLLVGALAFWVWRRPRLRPKSNVTARRGFTAVAGQMWSRLHQALPEHVVLMAVPVSRFVIVRQVGGLGRNQRRLSALEVDFAIFRADGTISSVVLLDDGDAGLTRRQVKLRRKLLDRAGIRHVAWSLSAMLSVDAMGRELNPNPGAYLAVERGNALRGAVSAV